MKKTSQNSLDSIQSSLSRAFPCSVTDVLGVRPTFQLPSEGNAGISLHHETLNASATAGSLSVQRLGATPPKIEMVSCGALPSFIDYDIIFNGLKFGGRYYPRSGARGLILLSYGQVQAADDDLYYKTCFAYLVKCLWFNKFAVASVFSGDEKLQRPAILDRHVMEIIENKTSTINNLEGLPLILVGTSETGHAMANFAYRLLIKQGFAHKYFPSATAVIGLGAVGSDLEVYGKDFSKNYLLISGSHDGEINVAESTYAYQYYDLLFGFKSLLFLKGANHAKYLEGDDVKNAYSDLVKLGQATQIQAKTQRLVVAQYVTMFSLMATHNGAYNDYRAVFKGDKIVNFTSVDQTINNDLTTLFRAAPLYSYKGGQFSLTITDNKITFVSLFQKDQLITPKQPAVLAPLKNLAPGVCFHSAMGYRVSWAIGWAINPSLVVEIAKEVQSGPEPKYFEFDAIQMPLSIFNSPTELDVQARLVYYGKMTKPVGFRIQPSFTPAPPPQGYSRAVLSTIRLAVSDFGVTIGTFKNVTNLIIELAVFRQTGEILFTPFRWA